MSAGQALVGGHLSPPLHLQLPLTRTILLSGQLQLRTLFSRPEGVRLRELRLYNLGKIGASKAIKSDYVKYRVKGIGKRYLNRAVDSLADNLSKKISGKGVDIHKAIGKLPKPKAGWTLPGHKYTGPYNDLENQVKWDRNTGQIYEIYDKPTGKTDAIAMQHDVDYSVCADKGVNVKSCKNVADKKMVRALDAIPWNERQWGHWLARNTINTKQKLGLGVKKKKKKIRHMGRAS